MKRKITLKNLCCANCASKIEEEVKKINGVKEAQLSFLMKKLTVEIEEEDSRRIFKEINKIVRYAYYLVSKCY